MKKLIPSLYVLLALVISGCTDTEQSSITNKQIVIAVSKTPLSTPLFIAKSKGYFDKYGVKVKFVELAGGHRCLKSVFDGDADLATTSDYPIMVNSFKSSDYAVLATFVSSDHDVKLMTNSDSEILTPAQLHGKRVGVVKDGSSHYFLDRFLIFNGMRLKDVSILPVNPEDMPAAIEQGQVDAISVWEPYGYLSRVKLGDKLIVFPAKNYYTETFNLVGKEKFIQANKGNIKNILLAMRDAIQFIHQHPKESQGIVIRWLGLSADFIDWIWKDFNFALTLDQSLILTLDNEARWAIANKIVSKTTPPDYRNFVYPDILNSIDENLVTLVK